MHRDERGAKPRNAFDASCHCVSDVVQFEIDKDLLARRNQPRRKGQSSCKGQLIADLVKPHGVAKCRDQRFRCGHRR